MSYSKTARNTNDVRVRFLAYLANILGIQFKIDGLPYGASKVREAE